VRALWVIPCLAGCQTLIDYESFAPDRPSCETGWTRHAAIDIRNDAGIELHDYPIALALTDAIPRGPDLRFALDDGPALPYAIDTTTVWVRVPTLPAGASLLTMYDGNPTAEPFAASPFEPGIIENPSFESIGGWTIQEPHGTPAGFYFGAAEWATDGNGSLRAVLNTNGSRLESTTSAISQPAVFPAGSMYVMRFDIKINAASNGGKDFANDAVFAFDLGNGVNNLWELGGDLGNITGVHRDLETGVFASGSVPLTFELGVHPGDGTAYADAHLDHLRVRKWIDPEPVATMTPLESCR
jgi:hypothetical protein